MGDDFSNLIDNEETNVNSFTSLDSIISVINEDGEEEQIDLYSFYREKSTKKKKTSAFDEDGPPPLFNRNNIFRNRKEVLPPVEVTPATDQTNDLEKTIVEDKKGIASPAHCFRDHHILRALEIQERVSKERYILIF